MPGARCARSLACSVKKHASVVTTVTPENTRHSPRNGFNSFLRALPGDRALLLPSPAESSFRRLDTKRRGVRTTRLRRPLQAPFVNSASASTASCPAFVTIANAPLWARTGELVEMICVNREAKYFCEGGLDRPNQLDRIKEITLRAHGRRAGKQAF